MSPPAAIRTDARNRMRWKPGQRGRYEGWYVAFNDPAAERGWWIRYSLRAPSDAAEEATCQLWFMRTDRARTPRNRALRQTFPIGALTTGSGPFFVDIGQAGRLGGLAAGTSAAGAFVCQGRLADAAGEVSWALRLEALLPGITPTPEWGAAVATCYMEPQPLLRVTGVINEGDVRVDVDGLLGEQAHVFGARHSSRWHWAEGKHLGAPGRAFAGVAAWPSLPGPERSVTSLFLDLGDGRRLLRNSTLQMLKPRTAHSADGWAFEADYGTQRLRGSVRPRREDLIGVTYHDPSGTPVYCYHSELADLELDYFTRPGRSGEWTLAEGIRSPSSCAFEYGSITPLDGVPLLLD